MKKYYQTIIAVEVLSEEPFHFNNLGEVYARINGECVGIVGTPVSNRVIDEPKLLERLEIAAVDPEFFGIEPDEIASCD